MEGTSETEEITSTGVVPGENDDELSPRTHSPSNVQTPHANFLCGRSDNECLSQEQSLADSTVTESEIGTGTSESASVSDERNIAITSEASSNDVLELDLSQKENEPTTSDSINCLSSEADNKDNPEVCSSDDHQTTEIPKVSVSGEVGDSECDSSNKKSEETCERDKDSDMIDSDLLESDSAVSKTVPEESTQNVGGSHELIERVERTAVNQEDKSQNVDDVSSEKNQAEDKMDEDTPPVEITQSQESQQSSEIQNEQDEPDKPPEVSSISEDSGQQMNTQEESSNLEEMQPESSEAIQETQKEHADCAADSRQSDVSADKGQEIYNEINEVQQHNQVNENLDGNTAGGNNSKKNTSFVQVNLGREGENEKEGGSKTSQDEDPIAAEFVSTNEEISEETEQNAEQGADEELCIIPDTERVISQEEKEAASALPTLRDLTEASASTGTTGDSSRTNSTTHGTPQKYVISKYDKTDIQACEQCHLDRLPKYTYTRDGSAKYICDDNCLDSFKAKHPNEVHTTEGEIRVKDLTSCREQPSLSFLRKCACCGSKTDNPDVNLTWEIMDFCNEFCLSKYQREIGSKCSSCQIEVRPNSLGKYCVRFGNDIRQFCTSHCLEEYKKGLKVCSYCQQDMSKGTDGFLAPVGGRGHFKDFCSQTCMEKYDIMTNDRVPKVDAGTKCGVCNKDDKTITIDFAFNDQSNYFCSEPCFVAFSFVNKIAAGKCAMCRRNFSRQTLEKHTMFYDNIQHSFCSNSCQNIYIIAHRKIVPCNWCKVKKYNFDMIRRYSLNNEVLNMCSVNCYSLYQVSINAVSSKKITCDCCMKSMQPMYHLTMSDATIRNFCSYACVMTFQGQFPKAPITINSSDRIPIVPAGAPKRSKRFSQSNRQEDESGIPVISSVQSLATANGNVNSTSLNTLTARTTRSKSSITNNQPIVNNILDPQALITQLKQQIIIKPYPIPEQRNVGTMVRSRCYNKGVQCSAETMCDKDTQTEEHVKDKILIPVPVPIYVPAPMHMFNAPVVFPVPIPLPIPIPIFIPTTRNSANGIMKEIKKIQVKIPSDPYEAELLMMAEMVADDKKEENTDSESDLDDNAGGDDGHFSPEPVDASNTFGDDMLQMALKMATELDEPAVDLEGALTANTITAPQGEGASNEEHVDESQPLHLIERQSMRGRKRGMRQGGRNQPPSKRGRRVSNQADIPIMTPAQPAPPPEPAEKPDANMCLKFTFGVNAWKQWVTTKNSELEKSSRRVKLFKTEILQLTADELNYSLCLFVKEVRKPNGAEYAPDTIYYLCLGIQQYLFENGRIDNIFCDPYYEKFTDCLDEVARKFSVLYNDSHYIVTRVEEEHLWESKQLGAHSPHVLLSTLMFFNTKHFNLTSVDEHMQLSFSHIMKHWKRNPNQPGASKVPGSRNVLLRFYPPQTAIQNNTRKKKVYEQQENEENPLRCPVKLYEFYLSKCPESVKTRNDVFYLQPERSCVPDSPVWYSTMPLPRESLEKMLHRVKMVKEINVALLTS